MSRFEDVASTLPAFAAPADVSKLPQPYAPADYSRFSPERPGPLFLPDPGVPRPKVFHLGVIKCL
jgi:hypothetical protein